MSTVLTNSQRSSSLFASVVALVALLLAATGCGSDDPAKPHVDPEVHSVTIEQAPASILVGSSAQLGATVEADDEIENLAVLWSSSEPSRLEIDEEGRLTAIAPGTVEVMAKSSADDSVIDKVLITVTSPEATVDGVTIDPVTDDLYFGNTLTLNASVASTGSVDLSVRWISNRPHIASVDTRGVVTAEAAGTVEITAESKADPTKSAQVRLEVLPARIEDLTLSASQAEMDPGTTQVLNVTVRALGAIDTSVSWSTTNAAVATVKDGLVSTHALGAVRIEAVSIADPDQRASVEISVKAGDVALQLNQRISIQVLDDAQLYVQNDQFNGNVRSVTNDYQRIDATFIVRPGLAGDGISLEAVGARGYYLRHQNFRLYLARNDGSGGFSNDATFSAKSLTSDNSVAFQSRNYPNHYIRRNGRVLTIESDISGTASLFKVTGALWTDSQWVAMPDRGRDVAVGADGTACLIGNRVVDGAGFEIFKWNTEERRWVNLGGAAVHIAVDPSGNPWVVNARDEVFYHNGTEWNFVAGRATDVAVGADGTVFIIGDTKRDVGGNAIYKRVGGQWVEFGGEAIRVSVDANGNPWIVNAEGTIYHHNGSGYRRIEGLGTDIAAGADGSVWKIRTDSVLARWNGSRFVTQHGTSATSVAVGPQGQNWHINAGDQIWAQF